MRSIDGIIFCLARSQSAAEGQAREARFLPALRQHCSVPVPNPEWYAPPSPRIPFGVIGYRKLPGTPLTLARLGLADGGQVASDLGRFLWELHHFPTERARELGLPGPDEREARLGALRAYSLPLWRQALTRREYRILAAWWNAFLADPRLRAYSSAVCHGDLWYENVLADGGARTVTAVLDFENVAIGDPAQDFATQLYLGEAFATRVIAAYGLLGGKVDADFHYRVQRLWELREAGMPEDPTEFPDQVRKLRAGPILNQDLTRG